MMTMMKPSSLVSLLLVAVSVASANQFVDDHGKVHTLFKEPRFICSATAAASLFHLGMNKSWVVGTWGSLYNRASNLYTSDTSEYFTMDAQAEDLEYLRSIPSFAHPACLDPSHGKDEDCWAGNDVEKVKKLNGKVDLIINLADYHSDFIVSASQALDVPVVEIDTAYDGALYCRPDPDDQANYLGTLNENCYKRSFLDVTNRLYDLAKWMGVQVTDDQDLLCKASQKLTDAAQHAHQQGIRVGAVSIQNASDFLPDQGITMFITNPLQFSTVRTMEELGVPIVWPGACTDPLCQSWGKVPQSYEVVSPELYFTGCPNKDAIESGCASTKTMYPFDFLLLEGYGYQQMEDDQALFDKTWPSQELLQRQYMPFPYDSFVYSHKSLAGWMEAFAGRLSSAKRLYPKTPCIDADVTSRDHLRFDETPPVPGGNYACYVAEHHNKQYTTCPPKPLASSVSEGLPPGAVAGIAIAAVVVGAILAYLIMKFILGYRTGIDKKYVDPSHAATASQASATSTTEEAAKI